MKSDIDLHDAMNAVASGMEPLNASDVVARGKRYRNRRQVIFATMGVAAVAVGIGIASMQISGPTGMTATPAAPPQASQEQTVVPSSSPVSPPGLEPSDRFVKGEEDPPEGGSYTSHITDRAIPPGTPQERFLRLVREPGTSVLTAHTDDVAPQHITIAGTDVSFYRHEQGVNQAEWIHNNSAYILQWVNRPQLPLLTEVDIQWLIQASIAGAL